MKKEQSRLQRALARALDDSSGVAIGADELEGLQGQMAQLRTDFIVERNLRE